MDPSSISDRAIAVGATGLNDDQDEENGNRSSNHLFIQSDRSRATELTEGSQQQPTTAVQGRPLVPGRHGNAERTAVHGTPSRIRRDPGKEEPQAYRRGPCGR